MGDSGRRFVIASTGDRYNGLMELLSSLEPYFQNGWKAIVVAQGYSTENLIAIKRAYGDDVTLLAKDSLIGAHSAKLIALNSCRCDVWCSLDDDMLVIPDTDFDKIADMLMADKTIGFISGNWARTVDLAQKKNIQDKLVRQNLVYTGGGLLFRDDVADIIRGIPDEKYLFDDCLWAMYAYVNGYTNYRYLGSVSVHKICGTGGRRTWLKQNQKTVLPPPEYLRVRKGKSDKVGYDEYLICIDSDLTELAHCLHKENLKCL